MAKYIRDHKVAVLYSPKFGAGWTTWNAEYPDMLYDPGMVELIEQDRREEARTYAELKWPDGYFGGLETLTIEWVPVGTRFRIVEHDGHERVEYRDRVEWLIA